jgi:hypothetical protein
MFTESQRREETCISPQSRGVLGSVWLCAWSPSSCYGVAFQELLSGLGQWLMLVIPAIQEVEMTGWLFEASLEKS